MKTLNEIANAVYDLAWQKGWHSDEEKEDAFIERACNNLHDEVSELHESWRNNQLRLPCDKAEKMKELGLKPLTCIEEEFADIVIRVLDDCKKLSIDIQNAIEVKHLYNKSRSYRHGNKRG
jgi:NTP pyrophosphatase (non-canonical NTP hydrolase)